MMQIERGKWYILHLTVRTLNFIFCGFSLVTATAISVERLVTGFTYSLCSQDFANSAGFVVTEFVEGTVYETRQTSKRDLFVRVFT